MTTVHAVAAGFADRILLLPGWLVLGLVFALPALEASAFVGFVFPGEVAVILGGVAAWRLLRRFAGRPRLRAFGDRLAATPPLAWIRRRFPRQVAWARRRLTAGDPRGFWLTFTVAAGALAAWAFGAIAQDVLAPDEIALRDPHVTTWLAGHRTGWLTTAAQVVAWLGTDAVLIPLVAVAVAILAARGDRRSVIRLALAAA